MHPSPNPLNPPSAAGADPLRTAAAERLDMALAAFRAGVGLDAIGADFGREDADLAAVAARLARPDAPGRASATPNRRFVAGLEARMADAFDLASSGVSRRKRWPAGLWDRTPTFSAAPRNPLTIGRVGGLVAMAAVVCGVAIGMWMMHPGAGGVPTRTPTEAAAGTLQPGAVTATATAPEARVTASPTGTRRALRRRPPATLVPVQAHSPAIYPGGRTRACVPRPLRRAKGAPAPTRSGQPPRIVLWRPADRLSTTHLREVRRGPDRWQYLRPGQKSVTMPHARREEGMCPGTTASPPRSARGE
jgi:hypothetical protein